MAADAIEVIRQLRTAELVDADGERIVLDFAPGLTPDEIEGFRGELGGLLPVELALVLAQTREIDGIEPIDFTGRKMDVEVSEVSPAGLPIAADGYGNFWLIDLTFDDVETAPVLYLCHDPPVVVFQSPSLGDFLQELVRMYEPPHESLVSAVHDDHAFRIWRTNPGVIDHAAALAGDAELRAFAAGLEETFEFVDLRGADVGDGFTWGRHGPRTEIRRDGYARLFAIARPEQQPGLLSRLFRR
jgi:hypothetical protein